MNLNRQESGYWLWGAALVLLPALTVSIVVRATLRSTVDLGPLNSFRRDDPTLKLVTLPDKGTLPIWVVNVDSHWFAFDGQSRQKPGCYDRWLPMYEQFWDVCSGWTFIWAKAGELLSYPALPSPALEPYLRDLDQYSVSLEGGHLFIDPHPVTRGAQHTTPPAGAACQNFDDGTIRWLRCSLSGHLNH